MRLDSVRAELHDWCESLRVEDDETVGYRMGPAGQVNLLSTTDVVWLRYAMGDLEGLDPNAGAKWARWIQRKQHADDGRFAYTEAVGDGNMHSDGHAFWHANRALGILGSEILVFPEYLRPPMTRAGLDRWFKEWGSQPNPTHHDVLGLIPILANTDDVEWVETFYRELAQQQDAETGTWPRGPKTNISRTFAYSAIFRATGRVPPRAEKIIDTMLRLQSADGFWREQNHSYFSTMDAIYILVRLPRLIGHKVREARAALERIKTPVIALCTAKNTELLQNTHGMLAVVHAIGLLGEAFPEDFPGTTSWRFDWDKPELFHCELLRRHLNAK